MYQKTMEVALLLDVMRVITEWHATACALSKKWIRDNVRPIRLRAPYVLVV